MTTLKSEIAANPSKAPAAVARALHSTDGVQSHWAARVTVAALKTIGPTSPPRLISAIVYQAVRAVPDQALEVVHAAMLVVPTERSEYVASGAAAALPHPWRRIEYKRNFCSLKTYERDPELLNAEGDFKSDGKDLPDPKEALDSAAQPMSLAAAVVQQIVDDGGSISQVMAAVDSSLIAPLGDSGLSNFGNEPRRPAVSAPGVPVPPPVSL